VAHGEAGPGRAGQRWETGASTATMSQRLPAAAAAAATWRVGLSAAGFVPQTTGRPGVLVSRYQVLSQSNQPCSAGTVQASHVNSAALCSTEK